MDDTALLETVREADPATTDEIANRLDTDPETVESRLAELESAGRITSEDDEWRLTRDPRLDSSVERMRDRLGREKP